MLRLFAFKIFLGLGVGALIMLRLFAFKIFLGLGVGLGLMRSYA